MKTRIIAGISALTIVVAVYALPKQYYYILFLALALLCCYEFMNMLEKAGLKPMKMAAYIWTVVYMGLLLNLKYEIFWNRTYLDGNDFLIALTFLTIIFMTTVIFSKKVDLKSMAFTLFGCIYIVVFLGFAVMIKELDYGNWLLGYVILGGVATDTLSYFIGHFLGKRKIIPRISPAKTVAGSIGGYTGCMIVLLAYTFLMYGVTGTHLPIWKIVFILLTTGAVAQVGDWCASYIKRYFKIKDFGKLIPGHGGLLDRLDSIIFLSPILYLIFII